MPPLTSRFDQCKRVIGRKGCISTSVKENKRVTFNIESDSEIERTEHEIKKPYHFHATINDEENEENEENEEEDVAFQEMISSRNLSRNALSSAVGNPYSTTVVDREFESALSGLEDLMPLTTSWPHNTGDVSQNALDGHRMSIASSSRPSIFTMGSSDGSQSVASSKSPPFMGLKNRSFLEKQKELLEFQEAEIEEFINAAESRATQKSNSLTDFNFEHLTKPDSGELDRNQTEYRRLCQREGIIPIAFIVRSLATTSVILHGQQLGPRGIKSLCAALTNNFTVCELEISEDEIDIRTMTHICDMLEANTFLTQLDFSDNRMGRLPCKLLLETLLTKEEEGISVISLSLSGNDLTDKDGDIFERYLQETRHLQDLDLSYNGFRSEAGQILGKSCALNSSIKTLSMRWNQLNYKGGMSFISGVESSSSITFLDLAWNGLGEEGMRNLGKMLKNNSVLEELDISANRINMKSMLSFMGCVKKNQTLRNLHIGDNIMSSSDVDVLLADLLSVKGELALKNLSLGRQTINLSSVVKIDQLLDDFDVMVVHGPVYGMKEKSDAEMLACLNPVTVLLEFGRLLNMTVEELFVYIDADGGGTLDRDELREGLHEFHIPIPERSLDILIRKMDSDGDGEIALSDLQTANTDEDQRRIKEKMMAKGMTVSNPETERIRCRKILRRLLAEDEKMKAAEKEKSDAKSSSNMVLNMVASTHGSGNENKSEDKEN